jgi:putative DNA primase/helicase
VHALNEARALLDRPVIDVCAGEWPRLVREAEEALIKSRSGIYQRAGQLVRIVRLEADSVLHGLKRSTGSVLISPVTKEYLMLALAEAASWQRYDGRAHSKRPADPPGVIASMLLASFGNWKVPALTGLAAAPTLRADGSLLDAPGYDAASGLYGAFDPAEFPRITPKPSREQALTAIGLLYEVFSECAFADGGRSAHASVAIAATIAAAVRHALPTAPAIGISAHKQGSGKTTAAKAIARVCTGRDPPVLALSDDEAELRKCLLGILIAGDACVLVDNIAKPVDSAALCALFTSATYSDRMLGANQRLALPTANTWILTGNHLEFVGDLTTRVLLAVLDPEVEHPEARPFKRDLAAYVAEHRGHLLAAALTVPLAYLAAGEPLVEGARSRFAEWDRLVRRPLLWLGAADPLETQALVQATDPVREALLALLQAWHHAFGNEAQTVARIVQVATEQGQAARPQLLEALQGAAGERSGAVNSRKLGRYLVKHLRRIEDGLRLEDAGKDGPTCRRRFKVTSVTSVTSVSPNPTREIVSSEVRNRTNAENADNAVRICPACGGEGCDWCTDAPPRSGRVPVGVLPKEGFK